MAEFTLPVKNFWPLWRVCWCPASRSFLWRAPQRDRESVRLRENTPSWCVGGTGPCIPHDPQEIPAETGIAGNCGLQPDLQAANIKCHAHFFPGRLRLSSESDRGIYQTKENIKDSVQLRLLPCAIDHHRIRLDRLSAVPAAAATISVSALL